MFAALALLALAAPTRAQTATPQQSLPDIAILATVHADRLTFDAVPKVTVTFPGDPRNVTVWKSDRTNLPDQVQPHVTYRDIGIRLTITSTLPDIEQILDDALGQSAVTTQQSRPKPKPRKR